MLVNKKSTTDLSKKKRRRRVLLIQCHVAVANIFSRMIDMLTSVHIFILCIQLMHDGICILTSSMTPILGLEVPQWLKVALGPNSIGYHVAIQICQMSGLKQSVCVYLLKKKSFKRSKKEISRRVTAQKHPSKELSELLLEMPWQYRT